MTMTATKPKLTLVSTTFLTSRFDRGIIAEIGGVEEAISSSEDIDLLTAKQWRGPKGPDGPLLINGRPNIFYVPAPVVLIDDNHFKSTDLGGGEITEELEDPAYLFFKDGRWYVLRAIIVFWYEDIWHKIPIPVELHGLWNAGGKVFYHE